MTDLASIKARLAAATPGPWYARALFVANAPDDIRWLIQRVEESIANGFLLERKISELRSALDPFVFVSNQILAGRVDTEHVGLWKEFLYTWLGPRDFHNAAATLHEPTVAETSAAKFARIDAALVQLRKETT